MLGWSAHKLRRQAEAEVLEGYRAQAREEMLDLERPLGWSAHKLTREADPVNRYAKEASDFYHGVTSDKDAIALVEAIPECGSIVPKARVMQMHASQMAGALYVTDSEFRHHEQRNRTSSLVSFATLLHWWYGHVRARVNQRHLDNAPDAFLTEREMISYFQRCPTLFDGSLFAQYFEPFMPFRRFLNPMGNPNSVELFSGWGRHFPKIECRFHPFARMCRYGYCSMCVRARVVEIDLIRTFERADNNRVMKRFNGYKSSCYHDIVHTRAVLPYKSTYKPSTLFDPEDPMPEMEKYHLEKFIEALYAHYYRWFKAPDFAFFRFMKSMTPTYQYYPPKYAHIRYTVQGRSSWYQGNFRRFMHMMVDEYNLAREGNRLKQVAGFQKQWRKYRSKVWRETFALPPPVEGVFEDEPAPAKRRRLHRLAEKDE